MWSESAAARPRPAFLTAALALVLGSAASQRGTAQHPESRCFLIWFTKRDCLEMTIFLITLPLLEAFRTPISRRDAAFKGFLGEVPVGPIPHLVLFKLCCFSEVFQGEDLSPALSQS